MQHYAGLDVSLKQTAACVVDQAGKIVREAMVASDPDAIAKFIAAYAPLVARAGLETGATSTWPAVEHEGMSRHRAAARFGVAVSTAIRWVARFRKTGSSASSKIGGYKPKTLRGEHAAWLIVRCQEKDFTISQLVVELREVRGLKADRRSVWEFLHGQGLSHKKNRTRNGAGPAGRQKAA
jgi:putative transposase